MLLASWLVQNGYSYDLQRRYRESQWLASIASGAMVRTGDDVDISGALYALQTQLGLSTHFGGQTALAMQGSLFRTLQPKGLSIRSQRRKYTCLVPQS